MTKPLPFTQATLRRAIAAVRKEGLHVHGIRPDGTVIVGENPAPAILPTIDAGQNASSSRWEDVEA